MNKEKFKRVIKEYAFITIGSFLTALGLVLFMTVVRNRKISQVTNVVKTIDPNAFMVITNAAEVLGEGFVPMESYKRKF